MTNQDAHEENEQLDALQREDSERAVADCLEREDLERDRRDDKAEDLERERIANEEFENPTSFEGMVGHALLGDDAEKEKQLRRIDCKLYASQKMFCECGNVHDQRKISILKDGTGKIVGVCCPKCRQLAESKLKGKDLSNLAGWTWNNWTESAVVQ
jgi:hypothetical protein